MVRGQGFRWTRSFRRVEQSRFALHPFKQIKKCTLCLDAIGKAFAS